MNRRSFFVRAAGAIAAAIGIKAAAPEVNGLVFNKYAFTLVYPPINSIAYDPETGIGIRYITHWDESTDRIIGSLDCMYGWPKIPEFPFDAVRLVSNERQFNPARLPA